MPYQGSSGRLRILQNMKANHSHCEIMQMTWCYWLRKKLCYMIGELIEIGRCYGMEMNVEKTKVMRISRQPFPLKLMVDQKRLEDVELFRYLGSMLTNYGSCTCEIKSKIAMAKVAFNNKRALFTSKMDLELRKKLVKCYIWIVALYGTETGTVWGVDQKQSGSFEMWCWRRSVGPIM
jgi:hypothetical protein